MLEELISDSASLILLGEPNAGKTPLGRAYLFAMRRRNIRALNIEDTVPCIRATPEIDFLRGEAGNLSMGDFLDDGCLSSLPMKVVKAFTDVGQFESMCWARWGAAKSAPQNQKQSF